MAALALRNASRDHDYHERLHDFAEAIERLLDDASARRPGGHPPAGELLAPLDWRMLIFVAASTPSSHAPSPALDKPLPDHALHWREKLVISFWHPRDGVDPLYGGSRSIAAAFGDPRVLWAVVGAVVLASILAIASP